MPRRINEQFDKYNRDEFIESIDLRGASESIQKNLERVASELRSRLSSSAKLAIGSQLSLDANAFSS